MVLCKISRSFEVRMVGLIGSHSSNSGRYKASDNFLSNCYIFKDDQTEENTFEILQHSDRNINNS